MAENRLLTDEEIKEFIIYDGWIVDSRQTELMVETINKIVAKTARIVRAEIKEYFENLIIGVEGCEFEERLDGDKGCLVLDMNQNQWDEYWQSLKSGRDKEGEG